MLKPDSRKSRIKRAFRGTVLGSIVLLTLACIPEMDPAIDEATVLANNTSVRIDASASARTLFTISAGERISVIEKRDTWYRVRDQDLIEGWMAESTILRDTTRLALDGLVDESSSQESQNTVRAREEVNLRLEPGRDTAVIRRLRRGTALDALERATTSRPGSDATDIWLKVRVSETEVGWVYRPLVEYDIPEAIRGFTEGRLYTAVQELKQVEDPDIGPVRWFVVAERRSETDPALDFDGIRVFIWNIEEHQYETTLRLRNLRGNYPLEKTGTADNPGFRFHVLNRAGEAQTREFVMRGTLPRESRP